MKRVYFIKPVGMDGPVKIGCSRWPESRRKSLCPWSPFPLEIVAEIEGDFDLERRFHAMFLADHSHHEWFRASPELLATIAAICAGTFDVATLPDGAKLKRNVLTPRKWTESQKAAAANTRLKNKLVAKLGRVPLDYSVKGIAAFVADPVTHGQCRQAYLREQAKRSAEYCRKQSEQYRRMAEANEAKAG
jgi:hypothetical protein